MIIWIIIGGVSLVVAIIFVLNNIKLKANNSKLKVENENLQHELGKKLLNNDEKDSEVISRERIDAIRASFRKKIEIKPVKQATKEDVEAFYKSQMINEEKKDND